MKSAGYGSPVEWHQDWAFYPHTNDDMLAVGVYLDDCASRTARCWWCRARTTARPAIIIRTVISAAPWTRPARTWISKAVPLTGKAGSMSFHHVRMVHGSAQNVSDQPAPAIAVRILRGRRLSLMGIKDWEQYNRNLVSGTPTNTPRIVAAPVRMPLPPAPFQGSIYENQRGTGQRVFETYQEVCPCRSEFSPSCLRSCWEVDGPGGRKLSIVPTAARSMRVSAIFNTFGTTAASKACRARGECRRRRGCQEASRTWS